MNGIREDRIRAFLRDPERRLIVTEDTASTNTLAKEYARRGAAVGTAVIADRQTAGRGRRGRAFFSPTGGVYLSVVLRPGDAADPLITTRAAAALYRAIRRFGEVPLTVKWVNDLLLDGKKIAGILAESVIAADGTPACTVLGFGVNADAVDFPPELDGIAGSLAGAGYPVDRDRLIAAILDEWDTVAHGQNDPAVLELCRRHSAVLGKPVTVLCGDQSYPAVAEAITDAGHLTVRTPDGQCRDLTGGEVSLRLG